MNARIIFAVLFMVLGGTSLIAETDPNDGFQSVTRGVPVSFPADFSQHPDFRLEWWYVTANLKAEDGTPFGLQWTLFRTALWPNENQQQDTGDRHIWFAHAAVTSADHHAATERWVRGGLDLARVEDTVASIDNWSFAPTIDGHIRAEGPDFSYDLTVNTTGPFILHGDRGYSQKAASGQASHYFSLPKISVQGSITLGGRNTKVSGEAWMDREWSSALLSRTQTGWDWFALTLDRGEKLMVFRVRDGVQDAGYFSGTLISPTGETTALAPNDISLTEITRSPYGDDQSIPTAWRIEVKTMGLNTEITALNPGSEMALTYPYWEGPVSIKGSHTGVGYMELTGYPR